MILIPQARFLPVTSQSVNQSIGIFVRPNESLRMLSIAYSFYDSSGNYNAATDQFISRLCVIQGAFADDVLNFTIGYNMNGYRLLGNFFLNDPGPNVIPLFKADDGIISDPGAGVTVLLAVPTAQPANCLFYSSLFNSSAVDASTVRRLASPTQAASPAAAAAAPTQASSAPVSAGGSAGGASGPSGGGMGSPSGGLSGPVEVGPPPVPVEGGWWHK
jgi:hypothetical protein